MRRNPRQSFIKIVIKDSAGNGLADLTPTATVSPDASGKMGALSKDGDGNYSFPYDPTSGEFGDVTVKVMAPKVGTTAALTAEITFVQSGGVAGVTLEAPAIVAPSGSGLLTATVRDSGGRLVADTVAATVTFTATGATGNVIIPAGEVKTNGGVATATFVAGGVTGSVTVTAVSGAFTDFDILPGWWDRGRRCCGQR